MEKLLNPDIGLTIWTMVTFACVVLVLGKFAWATEQRKRILAKGVHNVFHIVEDIGNELEGDDVAYVLRAALPQKQLLPEMETA